VKAALINDIIIRGTIFIKARLQSLLINKISPKRLIEGGAAILQMHNKNHHSVMDGII
jgi:hypothetical protein